MAENFDNAELRSLVERVETVKKEIDDLQSDLSEIYSEAKAKGYDPKYIKKIVALRKLDRDEIDEQDEMLKMYRDALGI